MQAVVLDKPICGNTRRLTMWLWSGLLTPIVDFFGLFSSISDRYEPGRKQFCHSLVEFRRAFLGCWNGWPFERRLI